MYESHITGDPAREWPMPVLLLDTRMGYMHALQGYIYEVSNLAIHGHLRDYASDKMAALVDRARENLQTWEQLRVQVMLTLNVGAGADKVKQFEQTAARVHADLEACLDKLEREMRGM